MPNSARLNKLIEAQSQGYLPSDWAEMPIAELLVRAYHARQLAEIKLTQRQWFLTQAEYLTEAAYYDQ